MSALENANDKIAELKKEIHKVELEKAKAIKSKEAVDKRKSSLREARNQKLIMAMNQRKHDGKWLVGVATQVAKIIAGGTATEKELAWLQYAKDYLAPVKTAVEAVTETIDELEEDLVDLDITSNESVDQETVKVSAEPVVKKKKASGKK